VNPSCHHPACRSHRSSSGSTPSTYHPCVSRRDLLLALVAPAVLVVVALTQTIRVHEDDQTSWKGASFGMFASIESGQTRAVLAWLEASGERLPVPDTRTVELARILPTDENAADVGLELIERLGLDPGTAVRVEVRGTEVADVDGNLRVFVEPLVVVRVVAR
jgi:hypothetical protein